MIKSIFFLVFISFIYISKISYAQNNDVFIPDDMKECVLQNAGKSTENVCKRKLSESEINKAKEIISKKNYWFEIIEDNLYIAIKEAPSNIRYADKPFICCEIQAYLEKISENIYGAKFSWSKMSNAMIDLRFINTLTVPEGKFYFNGDAKFFMEEKSIDKDILDKNDIEKIEKKVFINENTGYRKVTIIRGKNCFKTIKNCTEVYMPDGQSLEVLIRNSLIRNINVDNFLFIGIHNDPVNSINARIYELLYGYEKNRYIEFMNFVTDDLVKDVDSGEKPARRFIAGYSNGGAWALDVVFEKPDVFNGAIVMSPAEWIFKKENDLKNHLIFIGAGQMEYSIYPRSKSISIELKNRAAKVIEFYPTSGHSMTTWLNIWNGALKELNDSFYK